MNAANDDRDHALEADLIAYLDGELDTEATHQLEERLSEDADLRRRLQQHQAAWDLLDELPNPRVDERFAQTTVEMVAGSAKDEVDQAQHRAGRRRRVVWLLGCSLTLAAAIGGYALTTLVTSLPNRRLVEDLPVLENLDAYRHAEDIEFLRALQSEGLFTVEAEDAL